MSGHNHAHGNSRTSALAIALTLTLIGGAANFLGARAAGSLSNLADGAHAAMDALGITLALIAVIATNRHSARHSYGLARGEVVSAAINALLVAGAAILVGAGALSRIGTTPEVHARPMVIAALVALACSAAAAAILHRGGDSIAVKGAALEALADAVGSAAVALAGVLVALGVPQADTWCALAVVAWMLPRAWRLGHTAVSILLQASPAGTAPDDIAAALLVVPGVVNVHEAHSWTLTPGSSVLTAHVVVAPGADRDQILIELADTARTSFGIEHTTFQVEGPDPGRCDQTCN